MNSTAPTSGNETNGGNGATSIKDLFALSDEQILEIDPEPQDVEISDAHPDASEFDELIASASRHDQTGSRFDPRPHRGPLNTPSGAATSEAGPASTQPTQDASAVTTEHRAGVTGDALASDAPPQWLADRMSDPQNGAEARELWNSSQLARQSEQARQEAAAFREVFAKPDDARAAAQRARVLDDIDRAYFTGDATQRAALASSMLREDPAAFREMVFAGLRALEQAGQGRVASPSQYSAESNAIHGGAPTALVGAHHAAPQPGTISAPERSSITTANNASSGSDHGSGATSHDPSAALAAYTTFERSANEDLERSVGSAIDRTLDQALPRVTRPDSAAMKTRLAATIRQDVEKSLQGDRQLGEQVAQILSARRFDNESRASVVRLIGERAQQLVPGAAKRVLSEWTQTTLAAHRNQRDRADAATTSREVEPARSTGGPTTAITPRATATAASSPHSRQQHAQPRQNAGSVPRPGSKRGVDYRRLSDEQILDL